MWPAARSTGLMTAPTKSIVPTWTAAETPVNFDSTLGFYHIALDIAGNKMYWVESSALNDDIRKIHKAGLEGPFPIQDDTTTTLVSLPRASLPRGIALLLKPAKPRDLTATPGNAQVMLSWQAPAPDAGGSATSYEYRRGSSATGYTAWSDAGTGTSTVVPNLAAGTAYTFEVRALNPIGPGPESNAASTSTTLSAATKLRLRIFLEGPLQ